MFPPGHQPWSWRPNGGQLLRKAPARSVTVLRKARSGRLQTAAATGAPHHNAARPARPPPSAPLALATSPGRPSGRPGPPPHPSRAPLPLPRRQLRAAGGPPEPRGVRGEADPEGFPQLSAARRGSDTGGISRHGVGEPSRLHRAAAGRASCPGRERHSLPTGLGVRGPQRAQDAGR